MQPIGPLMHEHRLIERMIALMHREMERLERGQDPDSRFIDHAVDFIRYYADACHHGKEEEILFREVLAKPGMDETLVALTHRLIREHAYGRKLTAALDHASREHAAGGDPQSARKIKDTLYRLSKFYPFHIRTEDRDYFRQVMKFFDKDEMEAMLREFEAVDKRVLHERYREVVAAHEKEGPSGPVAQDLGG